MQVFLTIDTELSWRHHAAGLPPEEVIARSLEPAGVGIAHQLDLLARHRLKATFFVDPMPALVYGVAQLRAVVSAVLAAGQEVQLHLHPNWRGASLEDRGLHDAFELSAFPRDDQRDLIMRGMELLAEAGAPLPIAFRGGSYAANDDTLLVLASLGFAYDSSHNGAEHPWPSAIGLSPARIAPVARHGVVEVPVTVIEDQPDQRRPFQICALSIREQAAALDHAVAAGHVATTIVGHSFELAVRGGTRPNMVHARRFAQLCALLDERRAEAPTAHFIDRPAMPLDRDDLPLPPHYSRRRLRQVEQAWSNIVEERVV
ncbi:MULTISPECIES: polysaccharide deacetylase [unclassified Sphingomonas]|uniref:polysaccharide deacetylase n=1 Tax=unclassified Sphingomonas TaxID=196159 RepID=UPI000929D722|nr:MULTISPECIES: polysaccharide deacetylase [unclassified Sphingomonas]MBN8846789.1 polysaccharide deacetylase family protein [Sphingomonas sp.]OJV33809.1 MAG: polysaccharide deacetylase [Sphingomonas sp. 67-36]